MGWEITRGSSFRDPGYSVSTINIPGSWGWFFGFGVWGSLWSEGVFVLESFFQFLYFLAEGMNFIEGLEHAGANEVVKSLNRFSFRVCSSVYS